MNKGDIINDQGIATTCQGRIVWALEQLPSEEHPCVAWMHPELFSYLDPEGQEVVRRVNSQDHPALHQKIPGNQLWHRTDTSVALLSQYSYGWNKFTWRYSSFNPCKECRQGVCERQGH